MQRQSPRQLPAKRVTKAELRDCLRNLKRNYKVNLCQNTNIIRIKKEKELVNCSSYLNFSYTFLSILLLFYLINLELESALHTGSLH